MKQAQKVQVHWLRSALLFGRVRVVSSSETGQGRGWADARSGLRFDLTSGAITHVVGGAARQNHGSCTKGAPALPLLARSVEGPSRKRPWGTRVCDQAGRDRDRRDRGVGKEGGRGMERGKALCLFGGVDTASSGRAAPHGATVLLSLVSSFPQFPSGLFLGFSLDSWTALWGLSCSFLFSSLVILFRSL